jgi:ribonuclease Z
MWERLTIAAYSTALYSTWIFVEDLRLLLDAGDGVCAHLMGKCRKVHKVAVSHADRDHISGLLQLQQLVAHSQPLEVIHPADSGSFPALADFCARFDPGSGPKVTWTPVRSGERVELSGSFELEAVKNSHIPSGDLAKSVGYRVVRKRRKLRPEFAGRKAMEILKLRLELGEDAIRTTEEDTLLGYSGDTAVCDPAMWKGCGLLIHEATFLGAEDRDKGVERSQQHSVLGEVSVMAREAEPGGLVLNHFSSRYSEAEVRDVVQGYARELDLRMPVWIIPPGRVVPDLLATEPAWRGLRV